MRQYLESLRYLRTLPVVAIAPGHGAVIPDAIAEIDRVVAHRLKREEKLVSALGRRGAATLDDVLAECTTTCLRSCTPTRGFRCSRTPSSSRRRGARPAMAMCFGGCPADARRAVIAPCYGLCLRRRCRSSRVAESPSWKRASIGVTVT